MTGIRKLWVRVAAPVILLGGIGAVTGARRAHEMKEYLATFADSLKHGAGPLELKVKFVPFYVDGQRLGFVDAIHIERHAAGTVDSVRMEVSPRAHVALADMANECHLLLTSFDPDDFKHALSCEPEAGDNVRFGSVSVREGNAAIPLYLSPMDHVCAPWNRTREACDAARAATGPRIEAELARARAEVHRARADVQQRIREQVRRDVRAQAR
ncbi:MAG TPA: hypothetical protein VNL18_12780 [Gemmatimonadales bacterium]|nr:hypothetical protein [Gemmatimonadales bacterium]